MTDLNLIPALIFIPIATILVAVIWQSIFITVLEPLGIVKKNSSISQWSFGKKTLYIGGTYSLLFLLSTLSSGNECFTCYLKEKESGIVREELGTECGSIQDVTRSIDSMRVAREDDIEKHNLTIQCE
ncbi:MAG: hypothetical protein JKY52_02770 [Flavobacteriales bacterium]|nr:hypothetical protein [Flavobacteriales bacterium]